MPDPYRSLLPVPELAKKIGDDLLAARSAAGGSLAWEQVKKTIALSLERAGGSVAVPSAEEIYLAYPRRVGRKVALRAIARAAKEDIAGNAARPGSKGLKFLFERATAYALAVGKWPFEERRFIPHPATWFNQGRFYDDPAEWQRGTPDKPGRYEKI